MCCIALAAIPFCCCWILIYLLLLEIGGGGNIGSTAILIAFYIIPGIIRSRVGQPVSRQGFVLIYSR